MSFDLRDVGSFPGPAFGWIFYGPLFGLLLIAAYVDQRWWVIPKWLSLPTLACGLAFNLVRCGWVEANGLGVWHGFLFTLTGFATGFALFLAMWILGTCGGGDVKLFAAVGAWVGPMFSVFILCGTVLLVIVLVVLKLTLGVLSGKPGSMVQKITPQDRGRAKSKRRIAFSLPVAVSTICVALWCSRFELGLAAPHPTVNQTVSQSPNR